MKTWPIHVLEATNDTAISKISLPNESKIQRLSRKLPLPHQQPAHANLTNEHDHTVLSYVALEKHNYVEWRHAIRTY